MSRNLVGQRCWKQSQKGTTLLLALAGIVVALVMAALAIDISTLYLAHSEAQRAADAAALAAAKGFIASGVTTDINDSNAQGVAVTLGQQYAVAALQQNNISGQPGQLVGPISSNPTFDFTVPRNPTVKVVVQQTGLPIFFSRIWSRVPSTVSATALAEAYNPSGTTATPPVAAQCVKPFIIPNSDPGQFTGTAFDPFVDVTTGMVKHPQRVAPFGSPPGVVGETITFNVDCLGLVGGCGSNLNPPVAHNTDPSCTAPNCIDFVPAALPAGGASCPSCAGGGTLEQNISCCNTTPLACNSATPPPTTPMAIDLAGSNPKTPVSNGLQCRIHQTPGTGQDFLDPSGFPINPLGGVPFRFAAGANNPLTRTPSPVAVGDVVSTSDSLITLLIYDGNLIDTGTLTANIIGYMQVFVTQDNGSGSFTGVVLNISGCGNTAGTGAVISGGGVSPIPIRLIHN